MNGRIVPMFLIDEIPGADLGDLFNGVRILEAPAAEPGTITIRDDKGQVLGRIVNIGPKHPPQDDLAMDLLEARQEVERLRELLDGARNWVQDPDLRRRITASAPPKPRPAEAP